MKIAVMGTGGLGGYLGGRLAYAGEDVTFIARGERLRVLQETGLQIHMPGGSFVVEPLRVSDNPAEIGAVDLVLFCVKTYDAAEAAQAILPLIGAQTALLPVQNGVRHIDLLRTILGAAPVLGGMTLIGAHSTQPGIVESMGTSDRLEFGEWRGEVSERCVQIQRILRQAGIDAQALPAIETRMWWKFAAICGAGLFAAARGSKAQIWGTEEIRDLYGRAVAEVVAVAAQKGISLPITLAEDLVKLIDSFPPSYKPSLLVDLEQGRRLELEAWNGSISQMGKEEGIPTPVNDFIYACLKPFVDGSPPPTSP